MKRLAFALAVMLSALPSAAPQAAPIILVATLSGGAENPPVPSPGFGTSIVTIDDAANTLRIQIVWDALVGPTTMAHIHCCVDPPGNVGVATTVPTLPGFPVNVLGGTYDFTLDTSLLSSFNPLFVAANGGTAESAEDALFAGLLAGRAYLNIHTTFRPGGEIRGFFGVPEPSTLLLLGAAAFAIGLKRRRAA